ncbi:Tetratricopeptide repeat-containing protein isoform 2 [Cladophialophora immunda]|nr:Tetratricopeptide repeat-containing protein isoform 2 [Cladophialophora immunda]
MASSKAALKAVKASLDASQFAKAAEQAEDLLKQDDKNYTASLFLGFAREKLGDLEAAEKALHKAASVKPDDVQAYKGLVTLYDKQGKAKLDQYHDVAFKLAEIYAGQDDKGQCQNVIDKYELFAKKHGSRSQYRRALELILPTSSLYSTLEGRVLQPSLAYQRILESAEAEEREWVNTQIGERRTRLGAKIEQVTRQVKCEAISRFQIEEKYAALIDWTRDDDTRHDLEQKLFQRMFDNLLVLPQESKPDQRDKVLNMANGMVIIKHPFLLAWKVALEWVDAEELQEWDVNIFREFVGFFPEDGLSKVLQGFLDSDASPFPHLPVEEKEGEETPQKLSEAEQLILMNQGLETDPSYAPAYTLLGIYFQDYGRSKARARVALQKAFELSTSELEAAHRLAKTFADNSEWDLVELVAQRVVTSGKARPAPGSKKKAHSWPFTALGVVQMNKQHYAQAIVSFQHALRIAPDDYHSWVGLGESYHNAGRHVAATRAFAKAASIDHGLSPEETWFAKYMLANVQREMGSFDEAIAAYREILVLKPKEFGVLIALLQTFSESAWAKVALGMFGEAAKLASSAIELASQIAEQGTDVFNLWKTVGDACSVLGHVKLYTDSVNVQAVADLLQISLHDELNTLAETDKVELRFLTVAADSPTPTDKADRYLVAAILAQKRAVYASSSDQLAQAVSWYNLGWAEHQAYVSGGASLRLQGKRPRRLLRASMTCFKRAIELEAGNSDFWNALGVVTMTLSPKVSQHSFVRSLHLNENNAWTWTNLGVLYLLSNDTQLAGEAFTRAQSEDPEYAEAWIGQGFLAMLFGSLNEARGLFMHAFEIADSYVLPAKRHFALSAFDHLLKDPSRSQEVTALLRPLFALRQFHALEPGDMIASHLLALFAERVDDHSTSVEVLQQVCDAAEAEYEKSESDEYLVRYAQAKADLARAQLASGEFEEAVSNAETALDLSGEPGDLGPAYAEARRKWRLSAHLTAGLAHSHLKQIESSIKMFEVALQESDREPDVVCMLAQVLWAKGGAEEKEAARSQLFDVIENHPEHVQAVALLAVTGLLDNDEDVLEAVEEDLKALRRGDQIGVLDKIRVSRVLAGIVGCRPRKTSTGQVDEVAVVADALNGIMLAPGQPQGWLELAQAVGNEDDGAYAVEMAVLNAERQIPPGGNLTAEELARAYEGTGRAEDFLKAKMLAPWRLDLAA